MSFLPPHVALIASSPRIDRFARRHVRSLQRVRRPLLPNFFHAQRVCKCVHLTFFCPCMCQELFPEEVAPEEVLSRCFCFNCSNSQSAPGSILFQRRGGKISLPPPLSLHRAIFDAITRCPACLLPQVANGAQAEGLGRWDAALEVLSCTSLFSSICVIPSVPFQ